ncbi:MULTISPECIES: AAA family ATPase [unclassified Pseudovibrio]|uniref:AAA family ATPase n=1 Tax=unclassified Pseudovibrio TaxID=2627060 RepID=UPI0007AEAD3D|nr:MULTISPECIES: AAA family ATPase [unclassified Pseudovibrio]KZL01201.1 Septum site-determining protein MinD [Pseudovibrio sp. W74]KZL11266.1 Septum site-determining protein MinD [Pseudovibrio sp. Ad14]
MSDLAQFDPDASSQEETTSQLSTSDFQFVNIPRISVQAFCVDSRTSEIIQNASLDRRMSKTHTMVRQGGIPAAVETFETAATPNFLIVESLSNPKEMIAELDRLAEYCDAGTNVLVIGRINDVNLYRTLISRGVGEYIVGPIDIPQLINTIGQFYANTDAEPFGRTVAVIGAKGGCGASSVAHNLSWSIAKTLDNDVAIADLDLPFGTAGLDFNQDPLQGILEAIASPERLDDTLLDRLLAKCNDRLRLLAAPATLDQTYDFDTEKFDQVIEVMQKGTPTVVLDLPHTWNSWVRHILAHVDEVLIVAEPDLANLRNAKNLVDSIGQLRPNDTKPYLVLNKVGIPKRPEIKPDEFSSALDVVSLAVMPFEPALFGTASNNGQMIAEFDSKHAVAGLFEEIAAKVTGKAETYTKSKSLIASLIKKVRK